MTTHATRPVRHRDTYHHGDLRRALVAEGMELARSGGTEAVILREATRRAGVSPNAAYRHFTNREALLDEVALEAARRLGAAMTEAVEARRRDSAKTDSSSQGADLLLAACQAYIDFALREWGWFDVAFAQSKVSLERLEPFCEGRQGLPSGVLLSLIRDEDMEWGEGVTTCDMQTLLLSTLHGFAVLVTSGPLQTEDRQALAPRMMAILGEVIRGASRK